MNKLIILLMLFSFNLYADDIDKVQSYCKQYHNRTPSVVYNCVRTQMNSLNRLNGYLDNKYSNLKRTDPVAKILLDVKGRTAVVVDNKPWNNWVLFRIYFKRDMQTYLISQGKKDSDLDYGL